MGELVVRLDARTAERLLRLAASGHQSPEQLALAAILERVEELEDAPEALKRLKEIENGSVQPIPHEEAMRNLGLAD